MEIDFSHFKQILLSDRPEAYRPDAKTLKLLSRVFSDIQFFGFGKYYQDYWYILASSEQFPLNQLGVNGAIPINTVLSWGKPTLKLVSR